MLARAKFVSAFSLALASASASPLLAILATACSASNPFSVERDPAGGGASSDPPSAAPSERVDASVASSDAGASAEDTDADGAFTSWPAPHIDAAMPDVTMPDAAPITLDVADAGTVSFDVIAPERCEERSGHLFACDLPPVTVIDEGAASRSGPLKTTLTVKTTGNCSTQYPLSLSAVADQLAATTFHFTDGSIDLRRVDRAAIPTLTLLDASKWTHMLAVDDSCRVWVEVTLNRPDAP
jgi:hypothetical protein